MAFPLNRVSSNLGLHFYWMLNRYYNPATSALTIDGSIQNGQLNIQPLESALRRQLFLQKYSKGNSLIYKDAMSLPSTSI